RGDVGGRCDGEAFRPGVHAKQEPELGRPQGDAQRGREVASELASPAADPPGAVESDDDPDGADEGRGEGGQEAKRQRPEPEAQTVRTASGSARPSTENRMRRCLRSSASCRTTPGGASTWMPARSP